MRAKPGVRENLEQSRAAYRRPQDWWTRLDDHFAVLHQLALHCFPEIQDRFATAVGILEMLDPFGLTFLPEKFRDTLGQLFLMLTGFEIAGGVPLRVTGSPRKKTSRTEVQARPGSYGGRL